MAENSAANAHVFISYVREDRKEVDRLCDELKRHGVRVWLDRRDIKPGMRWRDAIRAITTLMETEKAVGGIFNVGSTEEVQIRDLAQKVVELIGSNSKIEYIPYEDVYGEDFEDMKRRVPDISKIHNLIGWYPRVGLDGLLRKVIAHERCAIGQVNCFTTPEF